MSRVSFHTVPAYKATTDVRLSALIVSYNTDSKSQFGRRWGMSLGLWGAGAGVAVLYVGSPICPCLKQGSNLERLLLVTVSHTSRQTRVIDQGAAGTCIALQAYRRVSDS